MGRLHSATHAQKTVTRKSSSPLAVVEEHTQAATGGPVAPPIAARREAFSKRVRMEVGYADIALVKVGGAERLDATTVKDPV